MKVFEVLLMICFIRIFRGQEIEEFNYKILEEQMFSIFVGNIVNDSNIRNEVTFVMLKQLKFQIWNGGNIVYDKLFRIIEFIGRFETVKFIDREEVCQFISSCILSLGVVVFKLDNELLKVIKVFVIVDDINDNFFVFFQLFIFLQILEFSDIGYIFLISIVYDGDSESQNSVLIYQFLFGGNIFSVRIVLDVDFRENLEIVVEKKLDREV